LCSSQQKVELLKELGCDRVINYKEEDIDEVLSREFPVSFPFDDWTQFTAELFFNDSFLNCFNK
jgi:NADPH:quinone reductase-like Zn-dependent oxidoreductase